MGCKFKTAECYAIVMMYKRFYKHEAHANNDDDSKCYASCDPKT